MTAKNDDALHTLQLEVERLLGRCLLRLQQYEGLSKAILASHEISGSTHTLETDQDARIADNARKTLGSLVGDLLGSYVVTDEAGIGAKGAVSSNGDINSVVMRLHRGLSDADFARTKSDLKELVLLRNNLVHHFFDVHDINSLDGCRGAHDALEADCNRIGQQLEQLRGWAEDMVQNRQRFAELLRSDEIREWFVNGIAPDGTVIWPVAGVVYALRRAARELAVDGWASLVEASRWIAEQEPEQLPAKYGCCSWQQVVHESRAFDLRYFETDGQRRPFYREKENSANTCGVTIAVQGCI